jgi:glycerol-3-phosphate dehydrogenase
MTPNLNLQSSITQYAGLRPNRNPEGLRVDRYDDLMNYINLSGVRSTGLTASAALGRYVTEMLFEMGFSADFDPDFDPIRKAIPCFRDMTDSNRAKMIKRDKAWGNVVCRCEYITEGELIEAIRRPIPATSIDAIKRRLRAGMGRCQGGFCMPRVLEILSREQGVLAGDIEKGKKGSWLVTGKVKGERT